MVDNNDKKDHNMSAQKVDYDNDGIISEKEVELELKLEKAEFQSRMALIALFAMIISFLLLLTPWISLERVEAIGGITDVYFLGLSSIIGAFMGFSAWMTKK